MQYPNITMLSADNHLQYLQVEGVRIV